MEHVILLGSNLSEGGIVALKMVAGVVAAAVLLYLVLVLSRVLGVRIEDKKYRAYCDKYRTEHGTEEGMLSRNDFITRRAEGKAIVWRREDEAPVVGGDDVTPPTTADAQPQADDETPLTEGESPLHTPVVDHAMPTDIDGEQEDAPTDTSD